MIRSPILHNIISNFSNSPSKLIFPDNQIIYNKLMGCGSSSSSDLSIDNKNNKVIEIVSNNNNDKNQITEENNNISIQVNSIISTNAYVDKTQTENADNETNLEVEMLKISRKIDYDSIKKKLYENNESKQNIKVDFTNKEHNIIINDSIDIDSAEVINEIDLQSISESNSESNYNDELFLDFETFILLPSIQEVLLEKSVTLNILKELFQIHDKDNDGQVNDKEREDLLELINLSYSSNSPYKVKDIDNSLNESFDNNYSRQNIDQISSLDIIDDNIPNHISSTSSNSSNSNNNIEEGVGGGLFTPNSETARRKPIRKLQHSQSVAYKSSDLAHILPSNNSNNNNNNSSISNTSNHTDKDDIKKSYEELRNRIMPIRPKSENHSKSKSSRNSNNHNISDDNIVIDSNTNRIPTQKRGFMMKHDSYDSAFSASLAVHNSEQSTLLSSPSRYKHNINNNASNNNCSSSSCNTNQTNIHQSILSHNRFFVLDKGYLSYMDSTSKKPPFSLNNRELLLKGMCLKVDNHHNIIELCHTKLKNSNQDSINNDNIDDIDDNDDNNQSTIVTTMEQHSSYYPQNESLFLEIKNASELDDWIDAFEAHIKFSDSINM